MCQNLLRMLKIKYSILILSKQDTVAREVENKIKSEGKDEGVYQALSKICMIDLAFIEQA